MVSRAPSDQARGFFGRGWLAASRVAGRCFPRSLAPVSSRAVGAPVALQGPDLYRGLVLVGSGTRKADPRVSHLLRQVLSWGGSDWSSRDRASVLVLGADMEMVAALADTASIAGRNEDLCVLRVGYGPADPAARVTWNPLDVPWMDERSLASLLVSLEASVHGSALPSFGRTAAVAFLASVIRLHREMSKWFTFCNLYDVCVDSQRLEVLLDDYVDDVFSEYSYEVHVPAGEFERHAGHLKEVTVTAADVEADLGRTEGTSRLCWNLLGRGRAPRTYRFTWTRHSDRYVAETCGTYQFGVLAWALSRSWDDAGPVSGAASSAGSDSGDGTSESAFIPWGAAQLGRPSQPAMDSAWALSDWYHREWLALPFPLRGLVSERLAAFFALFMRAPFRQVFCPRPLQAHVYNEPGFSLSPLLESVASGRMVAVDLAAVDHRPLVRALNVLLKRAWMGAVEFAGAARRRALLDGRTAPEMGPAVVVFNGYEDMVLAGSDDADADRLAFAGAPESECVPIVAVGSLSVLLDVLGGRRSCARLLDTLSSRLVLSADSAASAAFLDGFLWAGSGACGARACPDVLLSLDPEHGVCQVLREGRLEAPAEVTLYPPWLS